MAEFRCDFMIFCARDILRDESLLLYREKVIAVYAYHYAPDFYASESLPDAPE